MAELVSEKSLPKENKRSDAPMITKAPCLQGPTPLSIEEDYLNTRHEVVEAPVFEGPDVFDGLFDNAQIPASKDHVDEHIPADSLGVILDLITDQTQESRPRNRQVCCLLSQ